VIGKELNVFSTVNYHMAKWTDHQKRTNFSKKHICIILKERDAGKTDARYNRDLKLVLCVMQKKVKNTWYLKMKAIVFIPCSSICNPTI
jgi:hypothetical protein